MGETDTKQKILDASLLLFNEKGISNVRLQQIADETGISVGNLAYHYNTKEIIAESLITHVTALLRNTLRSHGKQASLTEVDLFFKKFYKLSARYLFFSYDILEIKRNFPASYELVQPIANKVRLQLEKRFDVCLQQQLLQKGINSKHIASNTILLMFFMPTERQLNGIGIVSESQYCRRLWSYLMVYFTTKGKKEYRLLIEPGLIRK